MSPGVVSRRIVRAARERKNDGVLIDATGIAAGRPTGRSEFAVGSTTPLLPKDVMVCAGDRVDCGQIAARDIHEALVAAVLALPVVHALRTARPGASSSSLPGGGVERDDGARLRDDTSCRPTTSGPNVSAPPPIG